MNSDIYTLLIGLIIPVLVIFIFTKLAIKIRKYGGSMITTMHASTYEFLSKDKQEAVEEIVERKANKKMDEESSSKPKEDL